MPLLFFEKSVFVKHPTDHHAGDDDNLHEQDRGAATNTGHQDDRHLAHLLPPRPVCLHPDPNGN